MVICPKCCVGNLIETNFSIIKEPNYKITCEECDYQEDEFGRII